jgi:hypothetical protein
MLGPLSFKIEQVLLTPCERIGTYASNVSAWYEWYVKLLQWEF